MNTISIHGIIAAGNIDEPFRQYLTGDTDFCAELDGMTGDATLLVNSYGGDVEAAANMGIALRRWAKSEGNKLTVEVLAIAASAAANLIAQLPEGISVNVHPETQFMFHSCYGATCGSPDELRDVADSMDAVNRAAIAALKRKTDLPDETIATWFMAGRQGWLNGEDAVKCGLATSMFDSPSAEGRPEIFKADTDNQTMKTAARFAAIMEVLMDEDKEKCPECAEDTPVQQPEPEVEPQTNEPDPNDKPAAECPAEEPKAECPAEEPKAECPEEEPKAEGEPDEIEQLRQEIAELKEAVASLKQQMASVSGVKAAMQAKPSAPRKTFLQLVREIPTGIAPKEYSARFEALKASHATEYNEYMNAHSNRNF